MGTYPLESVPPDASTGRRPLTGSITYRAEVGIGVPEHL